MKKTILKLGEIVTDSVTGLKGMLTIFFLDMDKNEMYLFQPSVLSPETHTPVDCFWLTKNRVQESSTGTTTVDLRIDLLGTQVSDKATNFTGTAIGLNYYMNGCQHFEVKPQGIVEKTGQSIKAQDFDLRRLSSPLIKELNESELEQSKVKTPSPEFTPSRSNR